MRCDDPKSSISVAAVGIKGQIVIPQEVRERLNIQPGDKVVLLTRDNHGTVLIPMSAARQWLDKMSDSFKELREIVNQSPGDGKET